MALYFLLPVMALVLTLFVTYAYLFSSFVVGTNRILKVIMNSRQLKTKNFRNNCSMIIERYALLNITSPELMSVNLKCEDSAVATACQY